MTDPEVWHAGDAERHETPTEKLDRNWTELLQELRVVQTGVQLLSGFLLTLPLQSLFNDLAGWQKAIYMAATVCSVVASGLLIAPVSAHRLLFAKHEKGVLVAQADLLAKCGLVTLAITVTLVLMLVFSIVVGPVAAIVSGVLSVLGFLALWVALPLRTLVRAQDAAADRRTPDED
ncbi:DUF6328 family protein [Branchiibius sp. NY16-3462-2]|uniref:DUF6328 family protein n=1 Tax=Branchiibius sp. NY16-3462-2 TaxID=1807500 RepID=UPI0025C3485E|nr:DUF6328 family protein [Branchiibius sp. NY16-3462-2]